MPLSTRTSWALTFILEQYVNFVNEKESYPYKNSFPFSNQVISMALKMIFEGEVFSPKEFSKDIAEHFNLAISPESLVKMSQGDFNVSILNITKK